jgi:hypothetical protein
MLNDEIWLRQSAAVWETLSLVGEIWTWICPFSVA